MTDLTALTIGAASQAIAGRAVSPVELLEAVLARLEETEPAVRAYARTFPEAARTAAVELEAEVARGRRRGPLHGIPISIKDTIYLRGGPTEAGSAVLKGFEPSYEATVVTRLRAAGAVFVGKAVTHEFAYGRAGSPTKHAWRAGFYPGGSSVGSAVSVAVRSAFGSVGGDTGGSIRIPSALNGIVGLKPSYGRVSKHGTIPLSASLDHIGPLARTVEDCALLLQAMAGYDAQDADSIEKPVPDYVRDLEAGVSGLRLGIERSYFSTDDVSDDVRRAVARATRALEEQGAVCIDLDIPALEGIAPAWLAILSSEASAYHRYVLGSEQPDAYGPATRAMLAAGAAVSASEYIAAQRVRGAFKQAIADAFRAHGLDAIVGPALPRTSVPIDELEAAPNAASLATGATPLAGYLHHSIPAVLSGQPAITIPCGVGSQGLAVGLQAIGRPFEEARLLQIARACERAAAAAGLRQPR